MARCNWTEGDVSWGNVAGDEETGDNEPTISFVHDLEGGAWCDVNATAAVWDALENRRLRRAAELRVPPGNMVHPGRGRVPTLQHAVHCWEAVAATGAAADEGG